MRSATPVSSLALALSLLVTTPLTGRPATEAVPASEATEMSEASASGIVLRTLPAPAPPGVGSGTVREVGDGGDFAVVGVMGSGEPDDVELRARNAEGGWTDWVPAEVFRVDRLPGRTRWFSEPLWTGFADLLEVRSRAPHLSVVLIDPGREPTPGTGRGAPPRVVTRAEWGADESLRCVEPEYADDVAAATLHHTAGPNDYTADQSAQILRGIYAYHAKTLGWCDIGYHVLVDRYGQVFEGRHGGLDQPVVGAHAIGFNTGTTSLSLLGHHSTDQPAEAGMEAAARWLAWKFQVHGIDPAGVVTLVSGGGASNRYPAGEEVQLPTLFAHRDVTRTECPGDAAYARLPWLRQRVAELVAAPA
ncbi:N-acetylmuramoyl-L-alanine amidase [Streptoalloteichus tenebrarius]|uniref:N-acetylmuramoyl-L-alanine amidase n=1 Tax=Streptoalloteichus tenebrarius (strain ATCC 17920 / DSM 40477 / JCM 4838 / CBS 697.72 / NBRC 16177 / NCIMB 11028 / NRRL B-12390 / A12253. 1 / ISP 5477) TaxID=1933 RepID=A0ABT1I3I2_STRSD|nr:peptidoglycan recognition protein [Streptoalloteichus tenebrarius]MCP2262299.1 N-acetylmuramoyl-L-alanine amidase [Streptoalloteichus tenebrarius]BFF01809.1 hypothetical protein GCM10020241_34840 [Streptoalloteichus tenebrarius]